MNKTKEYNISWFKGYVFKFNYSVHGLHWFIGKKGNNYIDVAFDCNTFGLLECSNLTFNYTILNRGIYEIFIDGKKVIINFGEVN